MALEEKRYGYYLNDCEISLDLAEIAPYFFRHKYKLAEKLCYEYNLRVECLRLRTEPDLEEQNDIFSGTKSPRLPSLPRLTCDKMQLSFLNLESQRYISDSLPLPVPKLGPFDVPPLD
ncbi:unnamed protein product [Microthlaspi erraticum]|uniref:Uncharacterized protein n=1 Tax=Microthlaspi erraticum TaxID=1685480 RepID=A0A6D2JUH5_9BRAS|nr:unnamed protein product [Microthlaspi erraticum]